MNPWILKFVILFAGLASTAANQVREPGIREWQSENGGYSVRASLVDYDRVAQQVTLRRADASTVEVRLDRLSAVDRRYVAEWSRVEKAEPGDSKLLYGIPWVTAVEDALRTARGGATPEDDRPVMWFRVLGELDGYL